MQQWLTIGYLVVLVVVFYFLIIRPQQRRAREMSQLIASLQTGDKVITAGGLYGEIKGIADEVVTLKIAENVNVRVAKSAVQARQK